MIWLLVAAAIAFAVLVWSGRKGARNGLRAWRLISGGLALARAAWPFLPRSMATWH